MVRFKSIGINEKFIFEGQTWIKVTPVKKSCCKILYNAHVDGNLDVRKVFNLDQEVQRVG